MEKLHSLDKQLLTKREKPVESFTPDEEQLQPKTTTAMSGGWEQKVWGKTRQLLQTPKMAIHELILETPGSFCSIHYHRQRQNIFLVLGGAVGVVVRENGQEVSHLLTQGKSLRIDVGVLHQFRVVGPALLLEVYLSEGTDDVVEDDIVRQHSGGSVGQPITRGSAFLVSSGKEV